MPDPMDTTDDDGQDDDGQAVGGEDDGLPGVAVDGLPAVRAGAFGSGGGLLGILVANRKPNASVAYDPNATRCPGPYDVRTMDVTGYTSGPESTGKKPGDPGYGQGRYGPVGPGSVAADPTVVAPHTQVYVPGYGLGAMQDTGRLIKGDTLDVWFPTAQQARAWGRQSLSVEICRPDAAKPPQS